MLTAQYLETCRGLLPIVGECIRHRTRLSEEHHNVGTLMLWHSSNAVLVD